MLVPPSLCGPRTSPTFYTSGMSGNATAKQVKKGSHLEKDLHDATVLIDQSVYTPAKDYT